MIQQVVQEGGISMPELAHRCAVRGLPVCVRLVDREVKVGDCLELDGMMLIVVRPLSTAEALAWCRAVRALPIETPYWYEVRTD